jgi:hypothetical protein
MLQIYEVDQDVNSPTHGRKLKFLPFIIFGILASVSMAGAVVVSEAYG